MDVERSFKLIGTSWRKEVFCSDCKFYTRASTVIKLRSSLYVAGGRVKIFPFLS